MAEDKEKTLHFIHDYKSHQILWDAKHKDYNNKIKRTAALTDLGHKYDMNVRMVKNKIKSLRSYFAKEHQKVYKNSAGDHDDFHISSWFAYRAMSFVLDSKENKEFDDNTTYIDGVVIDANDDVSIDRSEFG